MPSAVTVPKPVREYIEASNAFDGDRLIAAFADDALVNDARREFWGRDAIKRWLDKEVIGDKVTMDVTEIIEHYGAIVVAARMDGQFDKTNLPDELILTHYFTVHDGQIATLIIIRNELSE
jgi:hypothetical protein